ncbi:hypothetical protein DNTS_003157, partial [Danionella cerebrum]
VLLIHALMLVGHTAAGLGFLAEPQNRTARQMSCLENHEYPNNGFCCRNCEADQIVVAECTSLSNTKCECKAGTFCPPEEPCEVCKKCAKCKDDEDELSPCTATSNTKCRPQNHSPTPGPPHPSKPNNTALDGDLNEVKVPIDEFPRSEEEQENSRNAGLEREEEQRPESRPLLTQETQETGSKSIPVEDEDRGLGDSLPNTTNSSQTSLSALPPNGYLGDSPRSSPPVPRQSDEKETEPWARDDGPHKKLVPVQSEEESLSKSFDLFDVLDVRYQNKFFRSIGVSDNNIKWAETQQHMDKVYELLRVWMQKEGLRANINTLLQALLDLDQRYTAEHIASKAVERGFYKYE